MGIRAGPRFDDEVKVLSDLFDIAVIVLQHGAGQLAGEVVCGHTAVAEVCRIDSGTHHHRDRFGRAHDGGRFFEHAALLGSSAP